MIPVAVIVWLSVRRSICYCSNSPQAALPQIRRELRAAIDMARLNTRPSNLPSSRPQSARLSQSARQSLVYGTDTPAPGTTSDEENTDPHFREVLAKHAMGNLPTPSDTSENSSHSQKRKRVEVLPLAEHDAQEQAFNKYFDPNQDPDVRREVKRKSRLLEREFNGGYYGMPL